MNEVCIVSTGVACAIGIGVAQSSAAFRAGLSGYTQASVIGRSAEPLLMAHVPEAELETLCPALEGEPLTDRERRMLRLAGMALRQASPATVTALPVFLALPEPNPGGRSHGERAFLERLSSQAGIDVDLGASQCFELGRAGGLFALQAGVAAVRSGWSRVVVAGVDTSFDLMRLGMLDGQRRLLGSHVKDGFVPGEAAACLVLSRAPGPSAGARRATIVSSVGTAMDPGHRYSDQPALGVGLSAALDDAFSQRAPLPAVRTCFAGLNGENFGAKAWGVARLRHHERFHSQLIFEHPADCFGDVGAAMGTLLVALADETLRRGQRPGPMLVWASSDHAPCACAYLQSAEA